jgi:hypothetical protein
MMTIRKQFISAGALGIAIGIGIGGLSIFASWAQVAEHGLREISTLSMFLVFPLIGAFFALLPCLILLLFRKTRLWSALILLTAVVTLAIAIPLMPLAGRVRMKAFHRLEYRSAHLVHAITAYATDHGSPPETLDALTPNYIKAIPNTGIRAYPVYQYASGDEAKKWNDNPWVLYVDTPRGFLNWDMFVYFPKQNYPVTGYGGSLERIGTWAYVHE